MEHSESNFKLIQKTDFLTLDEANFLFDQLLREVKWEEKEITLFGKRYLQPRLIAYYGLHGTSYTYSGQKMEPKPLSKTLLNILKRVNAFCDIEFNSILLNFYRDGKDSMGLHSDDEPELGSDPFIASLSLGANRKLIFKPKNSTDKQTFSLEQPHGSLLLMAPPTQRFWKHGINKVSRSESRINLTFRKIILKD